MHVRRNLSKLRISAHNLAIETGRYTHSKQLNKSDPDKRLCFHCKKVESEYHLIFECSLYDIPRQCLFSDISSFTCIPFDGTENSFCILMSSLEGDLEVASLVCKYINACFEIRRNSLFTLKENEILCRPKTTTTRFGRVSKRPNRIDL